MTLNSLIVFPFLITFILAFPDFFVMISHRLFAGLNPQYFSLIFLLFVFSLQSLYGPFRITRLLFESNFHLVVCYFAFDSYL